MLVIRPSFLTVLAAVMTFVAADVSNALDDPGPAGRLLRSLRSGDVVGGLRTEMVRLANDPTVLKRTASGTDLISAVLGMPPSSVAGAFDASAVGRMVTGAAGHRSTNGG